MDYENGNQNEKCDYAKNDDLASEELLPDLRGSVVGIAEDPQRHVSHYREHLAQLQRARVESLRRRFLAVRPSPRK